MKIVSVMTGAGPGGAEFAAVELLDALVQRGHEAVMLSDWEGIGRDKRVEVHPLELGPKLAAASWPQIAIHGRRLRSQLRAALEAEQPYDVLLLHYKKEQLLAPRLPAALRPQIVWAEWGPLPRQMRRGPGRWTYSAAARSTETVLAISEGTRRSVVEAGVDPAKVAVLPNAMRTAEIHFSLEGRERVRGKLGIPLDAFVIGCTSRFHPGKRNDVVVEAAARLGNDVHLILAGDGESEGALRSLAEPLGSRAHFLPTPGAGVADLFSAFDVSVFCPSHSEGTPTSVVLGMLTERPCVATGSEGVVGLIDDDIGAIVDPENNPAALAAVLSSYQSEPDRILCEGALAAKRARERFDAAAVGAQAEQLLQARRGGG